MCDVLRTDATKMFMLLLGIKNSCYGILYFLFSKCCMFMILEFVMRFVTVCLFLYNMCETCSGHVPKRSRTCLDISGTFLRPGLDMFGTFFRHMVNLLEPGIFLGELREMC